MQDFIRLQSGRKFRYLRMRKRDICIEDVAHNLSQLCRFTGASECFYSVAEHCAIGSDLAPLEHRFPFLMHDSPESVFGDVNTILKSLIPQYKALEHKGAQLFAEKWNYSHPEDPAIKEIDLRMLATELAQLLPGQDDRSILFAPYDIKLPCWDPPKARREFLRRFRRLYKA